MVQTQFCKKVKFVRHDGAREFATSLQLFYEDEGIEQQTTVPYAHQTNGTAERVISVEKTAAVKKTPRQAASSVEASGRPSFAIPVGTGMYQ
uniref:Integrase catalytic domain-containing protein n=1 Tax=Peronospora matthiolae TaxID=2874970 RepID=A0AAV1UAQ1_9STRA